MRLMTLIKKDILWATTMKKSLKKKSKGFQWKNIFKIVLFKDNPRSKEDRVKLKMPILTKKNMILKMTRPLMKMISVRIFKMKKMKKSMMKRSMIMMTKKNKKRSKYM